MKTPSYEVRRHEVRESFNVLDIDEFLQGPLIVSEWYYELLISRTILRSAHGHLYGIKT